MKAKQQDKAEATVDQIIDSLKVLPMNKRQAILEACIDDSLVRLAFLLLSVSAERRMDQ